MGQDKIAVVPTTLPIANAWVDRIHRHHDPIPAGFVWWCAAAIKEDGNVCGVAICGRPTNRNNHDGLTVEVLRVATDGTDNAPSALLGSCARAAKAIGARRIITYTVESESGASLRGAGWEREADGIQSAWDRGTSRRRGKTHDHFQEKKVRWAKHFTGARGTPAQPPPPKPDDTPTLFTIPAESPLAHTASPTTNKEVH